MRRSADALRNFRVRVFPDTASEAISLFAPSRSGERYSSVDDLFVR